MKIEELDDYLYEIRVRRVEYEKHFPKDFWRFVGLPWFKDIAPVKAREYGFEAFTFLGPRAHIVDICGCHFRWKKLINDGKDRTNPSILNALRDGFGYAVILSVMTGLMPDWSTVIQRADPEADVSELAARYWDTPEREINDQAVSLAHRIPLEEFNAFSL